MSINIAGIWLTETKPETFTQAYHAGQIYSMVENFLPQEKIPPLEQCSAGFPALRELFGERLWQRLKASAKFRGRITVYEKLAYHTGLAVAIRGSAREFALGYAYNHQRTKLKRTLDRERLLASPHIQDYLESSS